MTERGRGALARTAETLSIGPSAVHWDGAALTVEIDEVAVPLPRRIRGRVTLRPAAVTARGFALDAAGRHRWWPIAPVARAEVDLQAPGMRWSGPAYLDTNAGDEPLEDGFVFWNWARGGHGQGEAAGATIAYDALRRDGTRVALGLDFDAAGTVREVELPPERPLKSGLWGVKRAARGELTLKRSFEDAPFYTRSELTGRLLGREVAMVHESLDLDRFANPVVKLMLPFRMPRRANWRR